MATESPIRIMETGGKWLHLKEAAIFEPSSANVDAEALGLLAKGQKFQDNGKDVVLNRSESAPPSIGGSFAAIENLMSPNFSMYADLTNLGRANGNFESEQLHTNRANLAYYCHNVNPPSNISLENQYLVRQVGSTSDKRKLTTFDGCATSSLQLSQSNLPTQEEENEDSRSPQQALDESAGGSSGFWSGQNATSSIRHKSSVDLSQEDDSHTLSPVNNESSSSSHASVENAGSCDVNSNLHNPSLSMANAITSIRGVDGIGLSLITDSPTMVSSSISHDSAGGVPVTLPLYGRRSNVRDVNEVLVSCVSDSDVSSTESSMKALNVSGLTNVNYHKDQRDQKYSCQNNMLQHPAQQQQSHTFGFQGAKSQMFSQGMNPTYIGVNQFRHGPSLSSMDIQPILRSSGFSSSPFTTAAAYMTPSSLFYPNLQLSGHFSPHYSVGTYPLNTTALGPFVAGYPPDSSIPVAFDGSAVPTFSPQTFGVSSCGTTENVVDMQHLNKFYGQLGFPTQPSFTGLLHMQYFQQPFSGAYNDSSQFDPLVSKDASTGNQVGAPDVWRGADLAASTANQKLKYQVSGGRSNLNIKRGGITSPCYFGSTNSANPLVQFRTSSDPTPMLPEPPATGAGFPGGRNEMRFLPGSGRNAAIYSVWQGRVGLENSDDPKTFSFLEELRSGKGRRFDLVDIAGHIVEFSADQHGSRFIQQKLENCSVEEKASVFKEVLPHASELMIDVFGNYVIQKFFEYGSQEQRKELANQLEGQILPLSLQMYGCRVIQKALEVIELELKIKLVHELDGHVLRCVYDQNGNHVIQKCIERIPMGEIGFIISAFHGEVVRLSRHPYGCRVIQRLLEHCTDELQSQFLVDEILESVCVLAQDQYGNYVTQHVLERGKPHERSQIIKKLSGHIVQMSQHKFASNVVEKCLDYGDSAAQELLIGEIIGRTDGNDNLLTMMKDQYANYVVQKILKTCTENQREMLLNRISFHFNALKKYTYGKHIVTRLEQLYGEEIQASKK